MSRKFMSILMSLLLVSFMFVVSCGSDDDGDKNGPGDGTANGGFEMESGSELSETELNSTLDDAFTKAGDGLGALEGQEAQNAALGLAFGEAAIAEVTGILGDADVFGGLGKISPAQTLVDTAFILDLLNGVTMTIAVMDVTGGRSLEITADGTCTQNPSISFSNTVLASGFLSTNFRNGDFTYNVGNLFDATTCGDLSEGEFDGTWSAEWAISADGTVHIFVDLDFTILIEDGGTTQTFDWDYVAEITISPDGSGNAVGSVSYSLNGTPLANDTFNVTWS